jgi:BASS family bile acid:Na+ symporter
MYGSRDRLLELLAQAGPAAFLLNLVGVLIGLASSRLFGLSQRESLAVAVELGIKNETIALMVTLTLLESSEMSIPAVVYSVMMYGFGAILIMMGRRLVPLAR